VQAVEPFTNHLPVRIRFGEGVAGALAEVLATEGARRPFVLLDPGVADLPAVEAALSGLRAVRRVRERAEPTFDEVDRTAEEVADAEADAVVAIGGGSTMDTAKAARLVLGQGPPFVRFAAGGEAPGDPVVPLVTVPTTAGTGSEVTGGAVVADPATHRKRGVASPLMRAQHALVDPVLTWDLPPGPTIEGAIDALAQAIAAIVVRVRTPVGDAVALEAVRLAAGALPALAGDPWPPAREARSRMACASLMAGLAMNISECGAEHSLAHALGGRFGLPHGRTVGLVLAEAMDHDRLVVPEAFERIADAMGAPPGPPDGTRAVAAVRDLLARVGFPTLRASGVEDDDVEDLAERALLDWIPVDPAPWSRSDVVEAYRAALAIDSRSTTDAKPAARVWEASR
jgi:choline dehydrogenase